ARRNVIGARGNRCTRQRGAYRKAERWRIHGGGGVRGVPSGGDSWTRGSRADHRHRFVGVDADEFVIPVRADIADGDGWVRREFPLYAERPGDERRRAHVRLHTAGNELCTRGWSSGRIDGQGRNWKRLGGAADTVDRIEGEVLIGAVAEGVLQIVVHAKSCADNSFWTGWTPCQADARLRQERGVVGGEEGIANVRLRRDHAVREGVVGGAAVGFVPSGGELGAEAQGKS